MSCFATFFDFICRFGGKLCEAVTSNNGFFDKLMFCHFLIIISERGDSLFFGIQPRDIEPVI